MTILVHHRAGHGALHDDVDPLSPAGDDQQDIRITGRKTIRAFSRADADHADQQTPIDIVIQGNIATVRSNQERVTDDRRVFADLALNGRSNMVTGANVDEHHLKGVTPGKDFSPKWVELRTVQAGEGCPNCQGKLDVFKALEIGHIFKLGLKYSQSMGAKVLDEKGQEVPIVMGSYGIGVERVAAAAVELFNDADGIIWPMSIAPFQVALLSLQTQDAQVKAAAEKLYQELGEAGIEVLYDDRDERPGVKFKDADLVGVPLRLAVGKKGLAEGKVELKARGAKELKLVPLAEVIVAVKAFIAQATPR